MDRLRLIKISRVLRVFFLVFYAFLRSPVSFEAIPGVSRPFKADLSFSGFLGAFEASVVFLGLPMWSETVFWVFLACLKIWVSFQASAGLLKPSEAY